MVDEFENTHSSQSNDSTSKIESLSRELESLRKSAANEIQTAWSEIEQLETEKALIKEHNSLIEEKIDAISNKNTPAPTFNREKGDAWEGWGSSTPDNAPWSGWNVSNSSGILSVRLSSSSVDSCTSLQQIESNKNHCQNPSSFEENEDRTESSGPFYTDTEDTNGEREAGDVGGKIPKSILIKPLSIFFEKTISRKNDKNHAHESKDVTEDHIQQLRHRLADLEKLRSEAMQQMKEKIRTRDENIKALSNLSKRQEQIIEEKSEELEHLRQMLKENEKRHHSQIF